jgi:hypothetical protein
LESQLARYGYHRSLPCYGLWKRDNSLGAVMIFNGLLGIAKRIRK